MKKEKYKLSTKRHALILLLTLFVFFVIFLVNDFRSSIKNSTDELNNSMLSIGKSVSDRLKTINRIYSFLEKDMEKSLKKILLKVSRHYNSTGRLPANLKNFYGENPYINLYIINSSLKVIKSTKQEDIGLDFSSTEKFSRRLYSIIKSGEYVSDRINLSIKARQLTKYSYMPSRDKKFIFEASYNMEKFNPDLDYDSIRSFTSGLINAKLSIKEINLYDTEGRCYNKPGFDLERNTAPGRYLANKRSFATKQGQFVHSRDGVKTESYLYYPYVIHGKMGNDLEIGIEVKYDNESIIRVQKEKLAFQASIIFMVVTFLIFVYIYSDTYLFIPLGSILEAIENVKNNNLDFKAKIKVKNEMKVLADHFNKMVESLKKNISEKEAARTLLEKAMKKKRKIYFDTTMALANSIEAKDKYTGGHCERVMNMSLLIADHIGLNEQEKEDLQYGSLLHDIGKIGIHDDILNKPTPFTEEEYELVKQHPVTGYSIVANIEFMDKAREIILHHHERYDGSGYPHGLAGENIPLMARIISIADSFDAMTSGRVYRPNRFMVAEAFLEMDRCSGTQFDPELLTNFRDAYIKKFGPALNRFAEDIERESCR